MWPFRKRSKTPPRRNIDVPVPLPMPVARVVPRPTHTSTIPIARPVSMPIHMIEDIENLKQMFPELSQEIAQHYLEINNGNVESALNQLLKEYETHMSQSIQPKRRSSRQPSSSRQVSSSRTPLITKFEDVDKVVTLRTFEQWIDSKYHRNASPKTQELKAKFIDLFGGGNWNVVDPKGDGWCGFYAATLDYNDANQYNEDIIPVLTQDEMLDKILEGMLNFYTAREQHQDLRIPLPQQLQSDAIMIEFREPHMIQNSNGTTTYVPSDNLTITKKDLDTPEKKRNFRETLNKLKRLDNTPSELMMYFAYAYKRNYLIFRYDTQLPQPYYTTYTPCLLDVEKTRDGQVVYPYAHAKAIMFNDGHYFLFTNTDDVVEQTVNRVLGRDYNNFGPKNLGSGLKKLRKTRLAKNKLKKTKFTTMKKQELRKHKYSVKKMKQPKNKTKKY